MGHLGTSVDNRRNSTVPEDVRVATASQDVRSAMNLPRAAENTGEIAGDTPIIREMQLRDEGATDMHYAAGGGPWTAIRRIDPAVQEDPLTVPPHGRVVSPSAARILDIT